VHKFENIKVIRFFDFDGTLWRNPIDTPKNRAYFEEQTGTPWLINKALSRELTAKHRRHIPMRSGWYGRAETLEPPLVPNPAPKELFIEHAVQALHESKMNSEALTIIMTGRHAGLKNQVLRICDDGGLVKVKRTNKDGCISYENDDPFVDLLMLGMDGPAKEAVGTKPNSTLDWKMWIIEQYLHFYPEVGHLEIWEDREEHKIEFEALHGLVKPKVTVKFVDEEWE
jgi:hypothetical protein